MVDQIVSITRTQAVFEKYKVVYGYRTQEETSIESEIHSGNLTEPLAIIRLMASNKKIIYRRTYGNVVDFISNIGGIIQIVSSVFLLIYFYFNRLIQKRNLILYGILNHLPPYEINDLNKTTLTSISARTKKISFQLSDREEMKDSPIVKTKRSPFKILLERPLKGKISSIFMYMYLRKKKPLRTDLRTISKYPIQEMEQDRYIRLLLDYEMMVRYISETNVLIITMNEMNILGKVFMKDYHLKLSPRVAIYFRDLDRYYMASDKQISSEEAYNILDSKSKESSEVSGSISIREDIVGLLTQSILRDYNSYLNRYQTGDQREGLFESSLEGKKKQDRPIKIKPLRTNSIIAKHQANPITSYRMRITDTLHGELNFDESLEAKDPKNSSIFRQHNHIFNGPITINLNKNHVPGIKPRMIKKIANKMKVNKNEMSVNSKKGINEEESRISTTKNDTAQFKNSFKTQKLPINEKAEATRPRKISRNIL